MHKTIYFFFSIFLCCIVCTAETEVSYWQVVKSEHFIVYYKEAPAGYVEDLVRRAEIYYNTIVDELGFTRFDKFWTWDKRCKIYIYSSGMEYQKATGRPGWSFASADVRQKKIDTFLFRKDFSETILPHELGHLIFREFVGDKASLPLWLDEGIACLQESQYREKRLEAARVYAKGDLFIPLEKLSSPGAGTESADVFYSEAASVIDFLLKKYGRDKFVEFCRALRDGKEDWQSALLDTYGFKDLSEMNGEWVKYLD